MDNIKFITGFNNGYLLAKYEPQLLSVVSINLEVSNEYIGGLILGKNQFELEQRNELDKMRQKSRSRENELGNEL